MVAKVLAERLKQVGTIICLFQSAFIGGRQILDSVLIANEAVEEYRAKGWILLFLNILGDDCNF